VTFVTWHEAECCVEGKQLSDPCDGSAVLLLLKVKRGVLYTWHEAEGKRLKNPFDTITEGVGLNRLTANFAAGAVDDAVRVSDREAVEMAAYLLR
jgi:cysteine synthase A